MSKSETNADTMSPGFHIFWPRCPDSSSRYSGTLSSSRKGRNSRQRVSRSFHLSNNHVEETQPPSKRLKKSPAGDLICPISRELPWDPVTAEDGRVYERECIEKHIKNHPRDLKSPVTNLKMGEKLLPAIQHRNTIETLVESGVIDGDLADNWNEKVEQKKKMEELLKWAGSGNGNAMFLAGIKYRDGEEGFKKDKKLAFQWYKKAQEAGNVKGKAMVGWCYLDGAGVTKQQSPGLFHLTDAASQGSDFAAYKLGIAFAKGKYGLNVDKMESIRWLEKSLRYCRHKHLTAVAKTKAQQKLDELKASVPASSATS
ncbi:Sel1 domain protein repeat-containing protein [Seminavis robusta]|uniref:Sel1 domain protein repeat-containing protein n=1 Tax=Seminavis robusta TaxID=568900 RepID=A0A9N8HA02_9STRA|nr:Sel1 domain protein repeat-containing protein [Seminavis robusta]|eukprot:Sro274_g105390.1 Sel1 domain protein repeat-containing protein (314) ;mRNA; r:31932-32873